MGNDVQYDLGYLKGAIESIQGDVIEIKSNVNSLTSLVNNVINTNTSDKKLKDTILRGSRLLVGILFALLLLKFGDATVFIKEIHKLILL